MRLRFQPFEGDRNMPNLPLLPRTAADRLARHFCSKLFGLRFCRKLKTIILEWGAEELAWLAWRRPT